MAGFGRRIIFGPRRGLRAGVGRARDKTRGRGLAPRTFPWDRLVTWVAVEAITTAKRQRIPAAEAIQPENCFG